MRMVVVVLVECFDLRTVVQFTQWGERESKRAKENFKEKKVGGGGVGEGEEKTQ